MRMRFALLASGSKGNSFFLEDSGTRIMIDCGGTQRYLKSCYEKLGEKMTDLDAVLITHDHSDHIAQIRMVKDLNIYSPVEIPDIDVFHVTAMRKFTVGCLEITPLPLSHDAPGTTGYVLNDGEEKLSYVTDTGYLSENLQKEIMDSDYVILESNHDVGMLMGTRRPQYLKSRIYSDTGHLNNEDAAEILSSVISEKTKMIILAHISQEANTRELALKTARDAILNCGKKLHPDLRLCAAGQFEMIRKEASYAETDCGSVYTSFGLECVSDL